jgi:predicted permease
MLIRRLRYWLGSGKRQAALRAEMEMHIEEKAAELRDAGLSESDALAQARRRFGNFGLKQEESREIWIARYWGDFWQDLRYATRAFRSNPVFALTAITCLVLGILPNTVLFNIAANALLNSPSVRDPKTLFGVLLGGSNNIPMREYRFVRDAKPVDGVVGMNLGTVNWRHEGKADPLDAARVTDHFFEISGIPLGMGRPIQSGETDVAVVSDPFWKNRLDGDPNVLGRRIELDGRIYTIAGVLPSNHRTLFPFGMSVDLYLPLLGENWTVWMYARVPIGMTSQIAADRFRPVLQELDRVFPDPDVKWAENNLFYQPDGPGFMKLGQEIGIPVAAYLAMLMIVVGLVLLMACANVSGLLLARASARTEELAIRFSLGAARGRIVRQLLAESLSLVLGATLAGLLITFLLSPVLTKLFDGKLVLQPDWRLLCYSIAMAAAATFVCGIMPALNSSRAGINSALKKDSRRRRWTLRGTLVVGQLAISVVLLCAGLLFLRNLQHASTMNPGFDVDHTVRANMHLIPESYSRAKRRVLVDAALERIRATPGIESASIAVMVPLAGNLISQEDWSTDLNTDAVHLDARFNDVGMDYFRTMQIPILQGRDFLPSDGEKAPRVVILNQSMARRLFGASNPVGHVIRRKSGQPFLVVGLARDSKYSSLGEENINAYYQSYSQIEGSPSAQTTDQSDLHFLIRASGPAGIAVAPANNVLSQLDPSAALDIKPMRENLRSAMTPSQVGASVLGSMGLLGLFLASAGLYGALLYAVTRRTREISLRVALGATRANILRLIVSESAILVGCGIAIGLGLAVFAVRPLAMFLIADVHPADVTNFVEVAVVLCLVAALAIVSPALRALRADPMTALRHE